MSEIVQAAWQDFLGRAYHDHVVWAHDSFFSLDADRVCLSRTELAANLLESKRGLELLHVCLKGWEPVAKDADELALLFKAVGDRAQVESLGGDVELSEDEFVEITWRLVRAVADLDAEMEEALRRVLPVSRLDAWHALIRRDRTGHSMWVDSVFGVLADGDGLISREDMNRTAFDFVLRQCPGGRLRNHTGGERPFVTIAASCAEAKAEMDDKGRFSKKGFEALTWRLSRMRLDVEAELRRFADAVVGELVLVAVAAS